MSSPDGRRAAGQLPDRVGHHQGHRHRAMTTGAARYNARLGLNRFTPRTREEIAGFFDELDMVEPDPCPPLPRWHALSSPRQAIPMYAGLGRKP